MHICICLWMEAAWLGGFERSKLLGKIMFETDIYAKAFSFHLSPAFCLLRSFPKGIDLFRDARDAFLSLNANWKSFISPHVFCAAGATKDLC